MYTKSMDFFILFAIINNKTSPEPGDKLQNDSRVLCGQVDRGIWWG